MAPTASLLILLSIAFPMLAISEELPEVFPSESAQGTHIQAVLEQIKRSCPPFGNPDERFSVTVLGTTSPAIGGCASMVPPNPDILPSFNLWLGNHKVGGGKCGDKNMDHFLFECMAKHPFFTDEDSLEGWYVMLYDRAARWSGRQDYRCALYQTINEDPPMIKMVISANQSCQGLTKRIEQSEHTVPKGLRHFSDGSVALQFSKDLPQNPMWRKKRSEVQGGGCRFPDWSQGSWTDLQIDGSLVRYDSALHEKDDVDYGKDGDAKITGGEQYIQRSPRQKRSWWWESKTSENYSKSHFPFNFVQLRKKRELNNEHDHAENDTKHRQKRCWGTRTTTSTERYRDVQFENPPKKGDPMEPFSKTNKYFGTTQNPAAPNRKRRFINKDLDYESESTENDEEEALRRIKFTDEFNKYMRWQNIVNTILKIKHSLEKSKAKINKDEYEVFPEDAPVPPPMKYLRFAEILGIPYDEALMNWRSLERAYRQKEAEVAYTAYPGQNHPDIVMRDFDQTFDGIEYDFNPLYPEGTDDDPTAYRALTLPGGYHIEPRLSRRTTYEQKRLHDISDSATVVSNFQTVHLNSPRYRTKQENTASLNRRMKRSSTQQNRQQRATTTFSWSCEMPVDNNEKYLQQPENGAKFLTYGGRIVENNVLTGNDQHNENYSKMVYSCLWLVSRGPNILEYSIIGTGMPSKNQTMQTFAKQLCSETRDNGMDTGVRNEKALQSRRPLWVTVTRFAKEKLVPTRCPVSPGIVFYGVVPAPPPSSMVVTDKAQSAPLRLCARLVSSADDCATGKMGPADQMKYTVSECVDQDSSTGTTKTVAAPQTIFEASGKDTVSGSWWRNKRHSAPTETSTVTSSVTITSTPSNMSILQLSSHNTSTEVINNITNQQTTESTATFLTVMNSSYTISSRNGIQPSIDITTMDPTNFTSTTVTTSSPAKSSTLPSALPHETTSIDRQIPSNSKLPTTATSTSTSTATATTTSSYHLVTDYHYRQQQQRQQPPQHSNYNNNDYYYRGRQQYYPPTLPGNIGTDNNNYYSQKQQQPHRLPQQYSINTNEYSNSNQRQTMDSSGHRTGNYYYRQQQQNYDNHEYNNDRQQQILQPPHDSLLALQNPNSGSWNVRGERPLYINRGGVGDNSRNAHVAWNSSSRISSSNNGGWTTAAQQYWWYQQQQRQQEEEQQQQLQKQQRQQQNNRGLGGILSLPPVPLPPLHAEQSAITVSMPTPLPLHPRRQQTLSDHYYQPTLTTKTSSQLYQLQDKSESRYYQEREYQCLGQWTEPQQQISPVAGEKSIMLTYTYLKRLNPITKEGAQYECFVGTPIPNDEGLNPETTTTILLTEAGTNSMCSRLSDPYRSGMKLVGTKIKKEGVCKGPEELTQDSSGGSWYSLKPQQISPSVPDAENGRGAWYAAHPVPVVAQTPTTMMPIHKGRHDGGNGGIFTSRQNEQIRHPTAKTNYSTRILADKIIVILLAVILIAGQMDNIAPYFFN